MPETVEGVLTPAEHGQRLDAALARLLPGLGVRARRRLWLAGQVLVNDTPRPPGYCVRAGDRVRVESCQPSAPDIPPPRLLARHNHWLFFEKPAGLHTVALAGQPGPSLEALLPTLCPDTPPLLCTRLDQGTSGIVAAAVDAAALAAWRALEGAGGCEKIYLTLLCGHVAAPVTVTAALDVHRTAVTRVLPVDGPPVRHTAFTPLRCTTAGDVLREDAPPPWLAAGLMQADPTLPLTWARAIIHKGARYQIRAHAAHVGHPLWGDARYGGGEGVFLLHHGELRLPGYTVCSPPPVAVAAAASSA